MRFELTTEQADFATTLDRMLSDAEPVAATRSWAEGDHSPGLTLWEGLAEQGVPALAVPEEHEGLGASPVELVLAHETLGHHAVPGPWIETSAYLPLALTDHHVLAGIAAGEPATVAAPPHTPYALDADAATHAFLVAPGHVSAGATVSTAEETDWVGSLDPPRRLFRVEAGQPVSSVDDLAPAADLAALATAAQLLGAGERLLAETVAYCQQRRQFGREIGSYQALKHQLADVKIALDFARPLVQGAAVTFAGADRARSVSAAKVGAGDAADLAARTALQLHGAIGYTREYDLSLWLTRVRALVGAWGTTAYHRSRVLASLTAEPAGADDPHVADPRQDAPSGTSGREA